MLVCGFEKFKKIEKLLLLTSISSDELRQALIGYYCFGLKNETVNKSNFRRAIKKIERINNIINDIKELDND